MNKHTPKPWIFTGAGIVGNANGMTYTVAEVNGPNRLDLIPMREANKALLCAAPELLEALEACVEYLNMAFNLEGDCFGVQHNNATDALSAAEVVISKAKGGA